MTDLAFTHIEEVNPRPTAEEQAKGLIDCHSESMDLQREFYRDAVITVISEAGLGKEKRRELVNKMEILFHKD